MGLTARVEDYLEAVLDIEMSGEIATVTQIAKNLGVTKATVTAALKRLKLVELLQHERYGDVVLTEEGRQRALVIYRRHEFLTDFFVRILGLSRERAQNVACVMEHEMDERSEKRLAAFTDAIVQAERNGEKWFVDLQKKLDAAQALPIPLCMMPNGSGGVIARLTAQYELRRRLLQMGLVPGTSVKNVRRKVDVQGELFGFVVGEREQSLGIIEASAVWLYKN